VELGDGAVEDIARILNTRGKVFRGVIEEIHPEEGSMRVAYIIMTGSRPGRTLYIQAAQHPELQGSGAIYELFNRLEPAELSGNLIAVPLVDTTLAGPEKVRGDMHQLWPGNPFGTLKERMVNRLFNEFVERSDYTIDIHCWSEFSLPTAFCRGGDRASLEFAIATGYPYIIRTANARSKKERDYLKSFEKAMYSLASRMGIPSCLLESTHNAGGYLEKEKIDEVLKSLLNALRYLKMIKGHLELPRRTYIMGLREIAPRARKGGLVVPKVPLGTFLKKGDVLFDLLDIETFKLLDRYRSPVDGLLFSVGPAGVVEKGEPWGVIKRDVKVIGRRVSGRGKHRKAARGFAQLQK